MCPPIGTYIKRVEMTKIHSLYYHTHINNIYLKSHVQRWPVHLRTLNIVKEMGWKDIPFSGIRRD